MFLRNLLMPESGNRWPCAGRMTRRSRTAAAGLLAAVLLVGGLPSEAAAASGGGATQDEITELSLEELLDLDVVSAASRFEQSASEAPSAVTIITARQIRRFGYRTLADALRSVRGIYTTYDRDYEYIGVRGFGRPGDYNTRVLLLVDGHRINDNINDQAPIGTDFPVSVDLIERIEVVRGPGSSVYGANAIFGVVNVVTKKASDEEGVWLSARGASFSTFGGELKFARRFGSGLDLVVSASGDDSDGQRLFFPEFDSPDTNGGFTDGTDFDRYEKLFARASFGDFTLQAIRSVREKGLPAAPWEVEFDDPRNRTEDETGHVALGYEHKSESGLTLAGRMSYNWYDYKGDYVWDYGDEFEPWIVVNKDVSRGRWAGAEFHVRRKLSGRHRLLVGTEYRKNMRQDQMNFDEEIYLDDRRSSDIWAVYTQGDFALDETLTLSAGIRHDHYDTFGGTTNPRLGLIWSPTESSTFKLLIGRAFRAPNAYESFYNDGDDTQKANPNLEPETTRTYELVAERRFGDRLLGTASVYRYSIDDLITLVTDPADDLLVFRNVDRVHASGAELELAGRWFRNLEGGASYGYQRSENDQTGERLTNSPRHTAKVHVAAPLFTEKVWTGFELQYVDRRGTVGGDFTDSSLLANLTFFSAPLNGGLEVSASVYNLFDETYAHPGSEEHEQDQIEQDGRSFRLMARYRF